MVLSMTGGGTGGSLRYSWGRSRGWIRQDLQTIGSLGVVQITTGDREREVERGQDLSPGCRKTPLAAWRGWQGDWFGDHCTTEVTADVGPGGVGAVGLEVGRPGTCFRVKRPDPCDFSDMVRGERKGRAEEAPRFQG